MLHSRSRPYHKNDNRFVEQKNSSLVRVYVGDIRLDTVAQTQALERIYQLLWLFNNCFQPTLRLCSKESLPAADGRPARIRRRYTACTAWQRLCEAKACSPEQQDLLQLRIDSTNPRVLHDQIDALRNALFSLPGKSSEEPENIFDTAGQLPCLHSIVWRLRLLILKKISQGGIIISYRRFKRYRFSRGFQNRQDFIHRKIGRF